MKTNTIFALCFGLLALLALPGCYTQLQSARDRDYDDEDTHSYTQESTPVDHYSDTTVAQQDDNSGYADNNYDGDRWHSWVGYNYYQPSYWSPSAYFSAAYNDPWYGFGFSYPGYTCYPSYYPYSYWYSPAYYNPYYYGYGYGYAGNGGQIRRNNRNFGSTRGGSGRTPATTQTNGGTSNGYAPTGRVGVDGGGFGGDMPRAGSIGGSSRQPSQQGTSAQPARREGNRSGSASSGRGTVSSPRPGGGNSGRGGATRPSGGSRTRGESGRSAPSTYTPPPSAPPQSSAPAPSSNGGGGSSSGGSRGGGRRP